MDNFNFRVANATPLELETGQAIGDTKTIYLYSYKTKYINGKDTGEKTNVKLGIESIPGWVGFKHVFEGNVCKITLTTTEEYNQPSGTERTGTMVLKQKESDKTISFTLTQLNFTYVVNLYNDSVTLGPNKDDTVDFFIQHYKLTTDGRKLNFSPGVYYISWAPVVKTDGELVPEMGEYWYKYTLKATTDNPYSYRRSDTIKFQYFNGTSMGIQKKLTVYQEVKVVELKWTGVSVKSYEFSIHNRENATMVFNPLEKTLIYYPNSSSENTLQIFNGLGEISSVIWGNRVEMSGSVTETSNGYTFTPSYVKVFDVDNNRVVAQSVVQPSTWVIQKDSNNKWINWQSTYKILWNSGMTQYYQLQFAPYSR